jgi:hypothetical protein
MTPRGRTALAPTLAALTKWVAQRDTEVSSLGRANESCGMALLWKQGGVIAPRILIALELLLAGAIGQQADVTKICLLPNPTRTNGFQCIAVFSARGVLYLTYTRSKVACEHRDGYHPETIPPITLQLLYKLQLL